MKQILVIPSQEFSTTYSGLRYLLSELYHRGIDVTVFLRIPPEKRMQYEELPFRIDCFTWWSPSWPKWRRVLSILCYRWRIVMRLLRAKTVLLTESLYLPEVAFVKKLRPKMRVIHYCQELHIPEEYPALWSARQYGKYAKLPDLVIDVEPHRAEVRKERFELIRTPLILRNTLPEAMIRNTSSLSKILGVEIKHDLPIVLYAGGIGVEKPFSRIVNAVAAQKGECMLIAFCATTKELLNDARKEASLKLTPNSYIISEGVSHSKLIQALHDADIGLVDYSYSIEPTTNQKYCAPTKLYEYLAAGLAVVGSNNDSLRDIIESNHVGMCAVSDSDESYAEALSLVLKEFKTMKAMAADVFRNKYSYEKVCLPIVDEIFQWIEKET